MDESGDILRRSKRLRKSASLPTLPPKPAIQARRSSLLPFKRTKKGSIASPAVECHVTRCQKPRTIMEGTKGTYHDRLMPKVSSSGSVKSLVRHREPASPIGCPSHSKTFPDSAQLMLSPDPCYDQRLSFATGIARASPILQYASPHSSPTGTRSHPDAMISLRDITRIMPPLQLHNLQSVPGILKKFTPPKGPERVLDCPGLRDDFYTDIVQWSELGVVAVGLDTTVYLWSHSTGGQEQTMELYSVQSPDYISCMAFSADGRRLAIGSELGTLTVFSLDVTGLTSSCSPFEFPDLLEDGVTALTIGGNGDIIVGHHSGHVSRFNVRMELRRGTTFETRPVRLDKVHADRIVQIILSHDLSTLAIGGNDNLVSLWKSGAAQPYKLLTDFQSAVKALAWCPWAPHLLAAGGGVQDCTVRFYNTQSGECIASVTSQAQITAILWSRTAPVWVMAQGSVSGSRTGEGVSIPTSSSSIPDQGDETLMEDGVDQLTVWSWPGLARLGSLPAHSTRCLHLAASPDGTGFISAAADENLKVFSLSFDVLLWLISNSFGNVSLNGRTRFPYPPFQASLSDEQDSQLFFWTPYSVPYFHIKPLPFFHVCLYFYCVVCWASTK